jgi:hypothetical protein
MIRHYDKYITEGEDERGVICDGGFVRSHGVHLMDYNSVDARIRRELRDEQMRDAYMHRPGFRTSGQSFRPMSDSAGRDAKIAAYRDYERRVTSGYRNPDPPPIGSRVGDPCTLNGWPGTLVEGEDGKVVCQISGRADAALPIRPLPKWKGAEEEEEEEDRDEDNRDRHDSVCDGCSGSGRCPGCHDGLCPVCHGTGIDPGDDDDDAPRGIVLGERGRWSRSGGEPDDIDATAEQYQNSGVERVVRRDVPDSLQDAPRQKADRMRAEYSAYDESLRTAYLRGND